MARIFPDSKTFVDLKMIHDEKTTLRNFRRFLNTNQQKPNKTQTKKFVSENFQKHSEFENWVPPDFTPSPEILSHITDNEIRNFTTNLVKIWPQLARKVRPEVLKSSQLYTIIPVKNGFIVPGGRFREFYYWDTYWIVEGLLLCEMYTTVRGILDNFVFMVKKYGFVPNGSRIYYLNRSQPPLQTLMVASYITATNDIQWLNQNIKFLDLELHFFLKNRLTHVVKNGTKYHLAHYVSHFGTPRPESYFEDMTTASSLPNHEKRTILFESLNSAAESGWDFSSRWIVDQYGGTNANLADIHTSRIIPVDLNAFLCQAFLKLGKLYSLLGNEERSGYWMEKGDDWRKNIEAVFYHKEDGIWYDWDNVLGKPRRLFYLSNFVPLWAGVYNLDKAEEVGHKAAGYLVTQGVLDFDGGLPTSLTPSGEQWDYPNAWPPLQAMVIFGLDQSRDPKAQKIAEALAQKWLHSNLECFYQTQKMFEKYDVQHFGESGNGGEYTFQSGFGWTNGVLFQLINRYYTKKKR